MHIILGLLGGIVTILVLLYRLADIGIDLGGLNPFSGRRRRKWRQHYEANPVFSLEDPREIAALLIVGVAKVDGDMSAEEKGAVLSELEHTISMEPKEARELLSSTVYLLGDAAVLKTQIDEVVSKTKDRFSREQAESLVAMMDRIAAIDGSANEFQQALIERVRAILLPDDAPRGTWG